MGGDDRSHASRGRTHARDGGGRRSPDAVVLTVRLPGEESAAGEAATVNVDAGGQAMLVGLVRNQSGIVDNYDLRLKGMPEGWWSLAPSTVYLVPFGSEGGTHEEEVTIRLHPPRSPEARAGPWPIELVATSRAQGTEVGSAAATLVIAPYEAFESRLRPERARGKRSAQYDVPVRNGGNSELSVTLRGEDADGEVNFAFDRRQLRIAPTGEGKSRVTASARRPLTGLERERRLHRLRREPQTDALRPRSLYPAAVAHPQAPAHMAHRSHAARRRPSHRRRVPRLDRSGRWVDGGLRKRRRERDACATTQYLHLAGYVDAERVAPTEGTIPSGLDGPFNFATSLGVVTIVLGVLALLGARSGTLTWLSGAVALIALVAFFLTLRDASGAGAWIALAGGVCALAAGILAAASRS